MLGARCRYFLRLEFGIRSYAKKLGASAKKMKQVHEEKFLHINSFAKINIKSDIYLKIQSADVHEYPNGDVFISQLIGNGNFNNCGAKMKVHVSDDEKNLDLDITQIADNNNFHCEVEVPIRADLSIECKNGVNIKNIYDEELRIVATNDIIGKDIRATNIYLSSAVGNINCNGLLLAKNAFIETKENGNVAMDKLQGDHLNCKTNKGSITTNSCYVESSKFETNNGCLQLKNIHKKTEVCIHDKADLHMSGVHGNLTIHTNGGNLDLQLSQIEGESSIIAENVESAILNIADAIEENSYIEIRSPSIELDDSLSHLVDCINDEEQCFRLSRRQDNSKKLVAFIKGNVKLGKLSWAESMRVAMSHEKK